MNQNYKSLMLGLMVVMAGQGLYSAQNINQLPLAKYFYQQVKNIGNSLYWEWNKESYWNALRHGDKEAVERALSNRMDVNARDRFGQTALMIAVERGHLQIVELLLDHGVQVNAVDREGRTVLMVAAQHGHLKIVELLLNKGARVNARDRSGWTALIWAVRHRHLEVVKLLLNEGDQINSVNNDGSTALMIAAYWGHLETVRFLLDRGAQVNIANINSWTAVMTAAYFQHLEIVKLLLARGADSTNVDFSNPVFASVAAVFRAQREDVVFDKLLRPFQQILEAYREFQAGRPQRLKEVLGISGSGQNMLMNMQQGKSSAQHRPYVARVEALLSVSRKDFEKVFKEECIAQLMYYLKTGKFADSREQAERFLGWPQPALAKTAVDERMPVEDAGPGALPFAPTSDTPKAPSFDYVPQAALFGDMNMPD